MILKQPDNGEGGLAVISSEKIKLYSSHLLNMVHGFDYQFNTISPSDWHESKRTMSSDVSAIVGKFSYDPTPYLREIVDLVQPNDPTMRVAIMKGAQLGFSTGILEPIIGWTIDCHPTNIILAARDEGLVKKMMASKIEQMIDSTGIRKKIRSSAIKVNSKSTGDTALEKQYVGGTLNAFSIKTPERMRQISAKILLLDDFEAAGTSKDAGAADSLFETRATSFGNQAKIFYISTPEIKQKSKIEPLYLRGDQRKWFIPCPCCGEYINLEWKTTGSNGKRAGMTWKLDDNFKLIKDSVGYICQSCGDTFTDKEKHTFNLAGEWRPTAIPEDETFKSYHLSSLYSPSGMTSWAGYVQVFITACPPNAPTVIEKYKTFVNTVLGETFEERGRALTANVLSLNTGRYKMGTVPSELSVNEGNGEIVMLTMAADLGGFNDDARLDYEIVAWSQNGASYSVQHGSIGTFVGGEAKLKNPKPRDKWSYDQYGEMNVWGEFLQLMEKAWPSDDGADFFNIGITGIDTGHFTQNAYAFIDTAMQQGMNIVGLKGKGINVHRKLEANTKIYSKSREMDGLYLVEVNQVKDELAGLMNLKWNEGGDILQPNGFMNFPTPEDGKYTMKSFFVHFEGEKKVMKVNASGVDEGFFWEKKSAATPNHFWDTRIYNMTIKEIAQDRVCKEIKAEMSNWLTYCQYITG